MQSPLNCVVWWMLFRLCGAYNLSPFPNYEFAEPPLRFFGAALNSSYFGYSMNLRTNGIFIGAPRARATQESQRKLETPGNVYHCRFDTERCQLFVVDDQGNINETRYDMFSKKKDRQLLGMAMSGGTQPNDPLVVCAPKLKSPYGENWLLMGICYHVRNVSARSQLVSPLNSIWDRNNLFNYEKQTLEYMFGEMGISVHHTENLNNVLIGAPGVHSWTGTVVINKGNNFESNRGRYQTILQTTTAKMPANGYLGYGISSGRFVWNKIEQLFYVASAPRINDVGKVFIFLVFGSNMLIYKTFEGNQLGAYFGHSLLVDDFNGDGRTDLAISAPFHSFDADQYDNGIVYVYLGEGQLQFSKPIELSGSKTVDGRFGMTMAKIGDIDRNGYADLAIGAPFEGDGVVYIFSGGPNGVAAKATQVLRAPGGWPTVLEPSRRAMFGLSISAGVDIDANGFNDIAIGAPNVDRVFVYRAYPVVTLLSDITPSSQSIKFDETDLELTVCWTLVVSPIKQEIGVTLTVIVQRNRLEFTENDGTAGANVFAFNATATKVRACRTIGVTHVNANTGDYSLKSIDMEVTHTLQAFPSSSRFDENVVVLNRERPATATNRVSVSHGCVNTYCEANLVLEQKVAHNISTFVVGSPNAIIILYSISNVGETAFSTTFVCKITGTVAFWKIPPNCNLIAGDELQCDINFRKALLSGSSHDVNITLDTAMLTGNEIVVEASVATASVDLNIGNNTMRHTIQLEYISNIDIFGSTRLSPIIVINEEEDINLMGIHSYEIRNNGPSEAQDIEVLLTIPIAYSLAQRPAKLYPIIDLQTFNIKAEYENQHLEVVWSSASLELLEKLGYNSTAADEIPRKTETRPPSPAYDLSLNTDMAEVDDSDLLNRRRRRRDAVEQIDESDNGNDTTVLDERVQVLNCADPLLPNKQLYCLTARISIARLPIAQTPITVDINFYPDSRHIGYLFSSTDTRILWRVMVDVAHNERSIDSHKKLIVQKNKSTHTLVEYKKREVTPVWIIFVSTIVGLIILLLMFYGLNELGFFKRIIREEMEELKKNAVEPAGFDEEEF